MGKQRDDRLGARRAQRVGALLGVLVSAAVTQAAAAAGWFISLGAYADEARAATAREALAAPEAQIVPVERPGGRVFRVALGPVPDGATANRLARQWQGKVPGAFPFALADPVLATAAVAAAEPVLAGDSPATPHPPGRPDPVATAAAETPRPQRPVRAAEFRLDPATERLLRDDTALQRELERLSRGLPPALEREIDAARGRTVSLREVRERGAGETAPTVVPAGYQLHRLNRERPAAGAE